MWKEVLLVAAFAPCVAFMVTWLVWVAVCLFDSTCLFVKARSYRKRILRVPPISTLSEEQLATRIWEANWLLLHTRCQGALTRPKIAAHYSALIEQYRMEQLSREAYELWRRMTLDGHFPQGLIVQE
jgi:hypothetical protein